MKELLRKLFELRFPDQPPVLKIPPPTAEEQRLFEFQIRIALSGVGLTTEDV